MYAALRYTGIAALLLLSVAELRAENPYGDGVLKGEWNFLASVTKMMTEGRSTDQPRSLGNLPSFRPTIGYDQLPRSFSTSSSSSRFPAVASRSTKLKERGLAR